MEGERDTVSRSSGDGLGSGSPGGGGMSSRRKSGGSGMSSASGRTTSFRRMFSSMGLGFGVTGGSSSSGDPELPLGDGSGIDWMQFETEEKAATSLLRLAEEYREATKQAAKIGAQFSEQLLLFFKPESTVKRDAAVQIHQMMLEYDRDMDSERYNVEVLDPCRVLVDRFARVREMNIAKREMLAAVEKYEKKHNETSAKQISEEKLGEAAHKLKVAINRYCEMEKKVEEDVEYIHANFGELAYPTLRGFIETQIKFMGVGYAAARIAKREMSEDGSIGSGRVSVDGARTPRSPLENGEPAISLPGSSGSFRKLQTTLMESDAFKRTLSPAPLPGNLAFDGLDDDSMADSEEPDSAYYHVDPPKPESVPEEVESGDDSDVKSATSLDSLRRSRTLEWEDQHRNLSRIDL